MKINVPANTKTVTLNIVGNEMLELKKKIEQGMIELKLSQSGLSKAIGHSRNYLSECLRVGVSTEKQKDIAMKIDLLLHIDAVSADVSDKDDEQHYSHWVGRDYHNQEIAKLKSEKLEIIQDVKNAEAHSLELKELSEKDKFAIKKLSGDLIESNKKFDNLQKANIDLMDELKGMKDIKNAWRFLAWVVLVVLFVFVYVVVR